MWQLGKDVANVGDSKSPHMWQLDKKSPHMWQMLWQMWEIFLDGNMLQMYNISGK